MIDKLKLLDTTLAELDNIQTTFDESLFAKVVTRITAGSATELRFRLIGGLTLTETISQVERRKSR